MDIIYVPKLEKATVKVGLQCDKEKRAYVHITHT